VKTQLEELRGRPGSGTPLTGPALRRALVDAADAWLTDLLDAALSDGARPGVALVAVGAYGRREPAFGSDLDLVLLHDGTRSAAEVGAIADRVWYPVWDDGVELDHSVRTVAEATAVADEDFKAALGLLDARYVAGDAALAATLVSEVRSRWRARAAKRLPELAEAVAARHRAAGEVAFLLEPDIKEGRGGLRDVEALRALAAAQVVDSPGANVRDAAAALLDVRGELHRRTNRDRLLMQEQDAVATALGYPDADELMTTVARSARTIAWAWDMAWYRASRRIRPAPSRRRWGRGRPPRRPLADGVVEQDGEVVLALAAAPERDPVLVLRAARAAARAELPLAPYTLERFITEAPPLPSPWTSAAREAFVGLLATGRPAVPVLETLDQVGLLEGMLPDWKYVRNRPQRNPYHRFTVDRHLTEAAANAAGLTRNVRRPDLLLVGALLHDIGKGRPGDHSVVGAGLTADIAAAMGFDDQDATLLTCVVRHHLLLPDTAARRDPNDPATIERVAETLGNREALDLLVAIAEADGLATGPTAWSRWKARLVNQLADRVSDAMAGSVPPADPFALTSEQQELLHRGEELITTIDPDPEGIPDAGVLAVTGPDRRGLMVAVTGVVALHRLDVRRAAAVSDGGRAAVQLWVSTRHGNPLPNPARMTADLRSALEGRLGLTERLDERERLYAGDRSGPSAAPATVGFDDRTIGATVVEVRAADRAGVLYRMVEGLDRAGLQVLTALVSTIGPDVINSFYVRGPDGQPLPYGEDRNEVRRAVLRCLEPVHADQAQPDADTTLTGR
jgi:[protein-PII] uridylyltransferase